MGEAIGLKEIFFSTMAGAAIVFWYMLTIERTETRAIKTLQPAPA